MQLNDCKLHPGTLTVRFWLFLTLVKYMRLLRPQLSWFLLVEHQTARPNYVNPAEFYAKSAPSDVAPLLT